MKTSRFNNLLILAILLNANVLKGQEWRLETNLIFGTVQQPFYNAVLETKGQFSYRMGIDNMIYLSRGFGFYLGIYNEARKFGTDLGQQSIIDIERFAIRQLVIPVGIRYHLMNNNHILRFNVGVDFIKLLNIEAKKRIAHSGIYIDNDNYYFESNIHRVSLGLDYIKKISNNFLLIFRPEAKYCITKGYIYPDDFGVPLTFAINIGLGYRFEI